MTNFTYPDQYSRSGMLIIIFLLVLIGFLGQTLSRLHFFPFVFLFFFLLTFLFFFGVTFLLSF